ncbi:hypothetical protein quinque_008813 [Culex quinquefasciatus]
MDNELNFLFAENHFGEDDQPVCFHLIPGVEPIALSEPIEADPSLDMPTVEIPPVAFEKPTDVETQHQLTTEQQNLLFEAIQQLPVTREGRLGRTHLIKHPIELIPGATGKRIPSYRWSPAVESVIDAEMDHAMSLTFLQTMSIESKSPRIARWALKLSKYDLVLQYKKGSENISADALSRSVFKIDWELPDPYVEGLKKMVEQHPDRYRDFKIVSGDVFKYITNSVLLEDPTFRWKRVVPLAERRKLVETVHNEAHLGYLKTLGKVRERFYWPRMASDAVEMISMDFLGPYPRSRRGNIWILVICDFFSKFVIVQCMKTATAPAVCTVLENLVFNLFGAPSVCITDNAKVFLSDAFKKCLDRYGVSHWNLAVYHPSPNPSERVNRVIVTGYPQIAKAIRTSVHESTGFTPFFINFGRNMVSSGTEYEHLRDHGDGKDPDPVELSEQLRKLYELVRENLHKAYQRYSKPYNLRSNEKHRFQKGDWVYKKNVHLSDAAKKFVGKFGTKFTRARVRDVLGTNTYVLEDESGNRISGTFHGSFLKKA